MRSCITATPIGFCLKVWRCRPWWNPAGGFGNFDDFGGWVEGHLTLFQRIKLVDSLERIRVSGKLVGFFSFVDFFPFFFVGCLRPLFYENASWDRSDWRKQSKHYWKWLFFLQLEATYFKDCASLQKVHLLFTVVEIVPISASFRIRIVYLLFMI
jgi:hypothetical protein